MVKSLEILGALLCANKKQTGVIIISPRCLPVCLTITCMRPIWFSPSSLPPFRLFLLENQSLMSMINLKQDKTPGENEHFIFRFRLSMLSKILRYWTGPMSLAIYVKMSELDELVKTIRPDIPLMLERKNIDIHFVIESGVSMSVYKAFKREDLSIILANHAIIGVRCLYVCSTTMYSVVYGHLLFHHTITWYFSTCC